MRPGRILLFLLAVVLTSFLLSLLTVSRRQGKAIIPHGQESVVHDSVQISGAGPEADGVLYDRPVEARLPVESGNNEVTPTAADATIPFYAGNAVRDSVAAGRQVRIIYYGDSQIEGDRVTSALRRELREEGGGTGPGMISPVMPVM